jgi:3-hydroxyacyl-[acyl-carrier-protein] dehydratase
MVLNSKEIQEIIPHRPPFLLVDRINELEIGVGAIGIKAITINEPYFVGHFPQEHVMPGVLIIEALAQVGAVAILSSEAYKGKIAYFAGIKSAKFRKKVIPGDTLKLNSQLVKLKGNIGLAHCIATVADELVCECDLIFAVGK